MNYVIWKNKDSRDIKGLIISELPPISKPKMRTQETRIDGVDGSLIEELGYESYDKSMVIGLARDYDIDEVIKYFSGTGNIIFSNEPDKYYKATIINQIDYERLLRYRTASVKFRVQPFKYSATEEAIEEDFTTSNILKLPEGVHYTDDNVEVAVNNGVFEIKGLTGNSVKFTIEVEPVELKGNYICNLSAMGNNSQNITLTLLDEDKQHIGTYLGVYSGNVKSVLLENVDTSIKYVEVYMSANQTFENIELKYWVNKGNVAKDFNVYNQYNLNVINAGYEKSKPILTLRGTGTIIFYVNNNSIFQYTFDEDEEVVIDSDKQDAYLGTILKNRNMIGEFPIFKAEENEIYIEGALSYIKIENKSRWL